MLGRTHACFGVATFGATLVVTGQLGVHVTPPQLAVGVVVAAGAALGPDLDEAGSTPGRALPLSHLPIFGGRRTRTHTMAAVLLVSLGSLACSLLVDATAGCAALMATMGAMWMSSFVRRHGAIVALGAGALVGVLVARVVGPGPWLVLAVPLPYMCHLACDTMTPGGVPWLMPISDHTFSFHLFRTGKMVEKTFVSPLMTVAAVALLYLGARGV